jgi:hypothetical protein
MAVKRALVFRAGSSGPTCAAYEVAIERGGRGRQGTIRPIRHCTNPATVTWRGTGLCAGCHDVIQQSPEISVARHLEQQ